MSYHVEIGTRSKTKTSNQGRGVLACITREGAQALLPFGCVKSHAPLHFLIVHGVVVVVVIEKRISICMLREALLLIASSCSCSRATMEERAITAAVSAPVRAQARRRFIQHRCR